MTLAVSSAAVSEHELRLAAENVRDELLELPSISQVKLKGTRDREISIELSEEELRRHNLTFNEISNSVQRASLNLTFGELRTDAGGVVLQTVSKRRFGEEFKDIPLITRLDGTIVTLGDVAEVRDGFVDEDIVTRFNGQPAVLVRVDATEAQSVVGMAREIKNWLAGYSPSHKVTVSIWSDRAQPSLNRLSEIIRNGVIGGAAGFPEPGAAVRPAYRDMGDRRDPALLHRLAALLRSRGPHPQHGDDLRVLPDGRHRRG